jgi:replicative DNA helicase
MQAENTKAPLARGGCENRSEQTHRINSTEQSQTINLLAERSVLGALIEDDSLLPEVISAGLRVDDFGLSDHRRVFEEMLTLHEQKAPVDYVTVVEQLGNDQGAYVLLASLVHGAIVHEDHVLYHVEILRNKSRLRQLLRLSEWIPRVVDDSANSDALIEQAIAKLERIARPEVRA